MFEHRDAFIGALRAGPDMRKRIFDSLEERYAHDLGTGRAGKILYDSLHSAVRDADVPGAAEEFEDRFLPLLDPRRWPRKVNVVVDQDRIAAVDGRTGQRSWIAALCAVAIVAVALALGLSVINDVVAKRPTRTKPLISHKQETEPTAEAPKRAKPTQVIREVQDPPTP
jgi:hypothetical protein